jgi:hypothetical protein
MEGRKNLLKDGLVNKDIFWKLVWLMVRFGVEPGEDSSKQSSVKGLVRIVAVCCD